MPFTFAIGDIHGCREQLSELVSSIELMWSGGTVVFLGDYIDRGPASRGVVERIMAGPATPAWRWIALKGNHEQMMVSALRRGRDVSNWLANGGEQTLQSFGGNIPDTVLDWADTLPLMHQDSHRIYVHAGVDESVPLDQQSEWAMVWRRPLPGESGDYWGKHLVHGHTPADENPLPTGNRTNIDSGCVFGGSLSAAVFNDDVQGSPIRFLRIENRFQP